ncbi:MAG: protein O-mannosyl-transferase family [Blastocatellia bacterium]
MTAPTPTANPLASYRVRLLCAAVVFAAALALYLATVAPTVTLVDSGELIFAARSLGVAHPPGFPLYVLLAHAFTWLPFGSVAARVNVASAVFAAVAAAMLTLVVAEMLLSVDLLPFTANKPKKGERKPKKQAAKDERRDTPISSEWRLTYVVASMMAGLLFACSRTLWAYATIAEVYTLNTALITIILFLMFRWRRRILEDRIKSGKLLAGGHVASAYDRWLYGAAFVFGLAMGVHHVSAAVTLPAFAVLVFATEGFGFFISRRLAKAALCAFAGLAIYLYLPLAAMRSPLMNWGDPRTAERIWWHITGRQYQVFFESSANVIGKQFNVFLSLVGREFGTIWLPLALLLAIAGLFAAFKRDRWLFGFLILIVIFDMAWALNYEIAEDKDAYYLPTFLVLTIAASFGLVWLARGLRATRLSMKTATAIMAVLALLLPAIAATNNFRFNNRRGYLIARDYVENTLKTIEPNGLLLTDDWQVYSPLLYLREVEGIRRDVVAIDIQQLRRTWYYGYLNAAYPEMMASARDRVDAFLEDLRHWEQDPDLYQRDAMLNERINTRFYDMLEALVVNHLSRAPVYATVNVATNTQSQNHELTEWLRKTYDFVPRGLVFQVTGKGGFTETPDVQLATRGLNDGSLKFDDDDVVKIKVLPVYKVMMTYRGLYLAAQGHHDRAVAAFKEALALDPTYKAAEQGLNESLRALRANESMK